MVYRAGWLSLFCAAQMCMATSARPFAFQCDLLDRMFELANSESQDAEAALEVLENVAAGKAKSVHSEMEARVGLKPAQLQGWEFLDATVRAYAFERVGDVRRPAALAFLQNTLREDIEPERSGRIWASVQIGLHKALMGRMPGEREKIEFLEATSKGRSSASSWAVEQLCNRGNFGSRPFIEESVRARNPGPDGERELAFCEARMRVMARDPDSVRALGSVLRAREGAVDHELISWAIRQLYEMRSHKADAELDRYVNEIESLSDDSVLKAALVAHKEAIRGLIALRRPK